jgi:hypothetical protein
MFQTSGFGYLLALRTSSLFDPSVNWIVRLWRYGSVPQLRELLDLAANRAPLGARANALTAARRVLERDPAIPPRRRGLILNTLPKTSELDRFVLYSNSYLILDQEVNSLQEEYIGFWIELIANIGEDASPADANMDVDLCSWLIGSHLRSCGLSAKWILNHCNYETKRKPTPSSMVNLLEVADKVRKSVGPFIFLLPLERSAHINSRTDIPWLSRTTFNRRFVELFPNIPVPQCNGGLQFDVIAADKYSAISAATRQLLRAETRAKVSSNRRKLIHNSTAWMSPGQARVDLTPAPRDEFRVPALDVNGGQYLFQQVSEEIEAAFDLLTNIESDSERSACVRAWAALESLLAGPEDFGNLSDIADRAADILTCCYITEEFTSIATAHTRLAQDQLTAHLSGQDSVDRIRIIENHVASGGAISAGDGIGATMIDQIGRIVKAPAELVNLHNDLAAAFRRLYQARNQIAHAGMLQPYGIDMLVPSAQILLSELIDKTITASRTSGDPAGLLAAKARWSLQRVGDGQSLSLLGSL